jgi:hypothetical protein
MRTTATVSSMLTSMMMLEAYKEGRGGVTYLAGSPVVTQFRNGSSRAWSALGVGAEYCGDHTCRMGILGRVNRENSKG